MDLPLNLARLTEIVGTKFNLPTLTRAMGFTGWEAQLMSAPPYVSRTLQGYTCEVVLIRVPITR